MLNLHTNEQQPIDINNQCTAPHIDVNGGWAVGSLWMAPKDQCKLIAAPTLEDLGKQLGDYIFLDGLNDQKNPWGIIEDDLRSPRISGGVIIYEGGAGFYYAIVPPYCGDGTPNGNETPQSCPKDFGINPTPDTVQPEPQPDTTVVPPDQDIAEETVGQIDVIVGPDSKPDTQPLPVDTSQPIDTPQDTTQDIAKPKQDTGQDPTPQIDTPEDSSQDSVTPPKPDADAGTETGKPDTVPLKEDVPQPPKDTNPPNGDTLPPPLGKDTANLEKDTATQEPKEESGGGGGCSVTW